MLLFTRDKQVHRNQWWNWTGNSTCISMLVTELSWNFSSAVNLFYLVVKSINTWNILYEWLTFVIVGKYGWVLEITEGEFLVGCEHCTYLYSAHLALLYHSLSFLVCMKSLPLLLVLEFPLASKSFFLLSKRIFFIMKSTKSFRVNYFMKSKCLN